MPRDLHVHKSPATLYPIAPHCVFVNPADAATESDDYSHFDFSAAITNTLVAIIDRSDWAHKGFMSVGVKHDSMDQQTASYNYNLMVAGCDTLPTAGFATLDYMQHVHEILAAPWNVNSVPASCNETPAFRAKSKYVLLFVTATTTNPNDATAQVVVTEWDEDNVNYADPV